MGRLHTTQDVALFFARARERALQGLLGEEISSEAAPILENLIGIWVGGCEREGVAVWEPRINKQLID